MKHNRIIILAATAMAFAGCSSTDDLEGQSGKELKFTSDISAITPVKMETRASVLATSPDIEAMTLAEKDTILPENQILTRTDSWSARSTSDVAVQIGGGNVYKYTVDNNGVLSSSSTYYFTSLSDQTVAAWFPYSAAFSQFSVKGDQRTLANYNASDLLYATCTVNQNSTGNDLTFAHKTAKIIVNVTVENANYLLNSTINSVTLSGVNLTGSFSNGTLTATNTTGTVQMYNSSASTVTGTTAAATFEACVAPKSSTGDITVTVNVGGTNYTGTLSGGKNLRAGYGHNISVNINKDKLYILGGSTIAVGDYYAMATNGQAVVVKYSSLTAARNKGINPVALVFSTSITQGSYNHGVAIALNDVGTAYNWAKTNGHSINPVTARYNDFSMLEKETTQGFNKTYGSQKAYSDNPEYYALYYAKRYSVTYPPASSGWYLPSAGEVCAIQKNLADCSSYIWSEGGANWRAQNSNVNKYDTYFTAASGSLITGWHWTATEGYFQDNYKGVLVWNLKDWEDWHPTDQVFHLRSILAF